LPRALKDCQKAIELDPHYPEAYANLGYVYLRLHKDEEALKNINLAARLGEASAATYLKAREEKLKRGLGKHRQAPQKK